MSTPEDSGIEHVKNELYKRGAPHDERHRRALHELEHEEVSSSWGTSPTTNEKTVEEYDPAHVLEELQQGRVPGMESTEPDIFNDPRFDRERKEIENKKSISSRIIKGIFVVSLVFFICAAGFAAYFLIGGVNQVSCNNVKINMSGPKSIASGKKLSLDIDVQNNNPVPLRNTELEVVYPDGARDAEYSSVRLPSTKLQIGTVEVGERVRSTVHSLLFGQEMEKQQVTAKVTFDIDDSSASPTCNELFEVTIATAPVRVAVSGLEEISSGQELELEVTITSNSEETVPDLRLVVDYPFGFDFVSADPGPVSGDNVWELGDLAPGMERSLVLRGVVRGQGTEARAIDIEVGEKDSASADGLVTVLQKLSHPLLITKPFLSLELKLNNDASSEVVGQLGKAITGSIYWKNTTDNPLHDVEIDAVFDGVMLAQPTVTAHTGYYRSVDDTITWTPQTTQEQFRVVEPYEEGVLTFQFKTEEFDYRTSVTNPVLYIELEARAHRISDSISVPQSLTGQSKRTILFDTNPILNAYAVYNLGPFSNTGPHPPRVDKETTYTVVWSISNTTNDFRSTEVRGVLPVYVKWLGTYSPTDENVTYNPVTREVIWSPEGIARGAGYESPSKDLYFQVSAIPSVTQINDPLTLVYTPTLQGVDSFTGNVIEREIRLIESHLTNDPYFKDVSGDVEP